MIMSSALANIRSSVRLDCETSKGTFKMGYCEGNSKHSSIGSRYQPRCWQHGRPTMRLAGKFSRCTFHIFLKDGGEVRGIAETTAFRDFGNIEARVHQGSLGQ